MAWGAEPDRSPLADDARTVEMRMLRMKQTMSEYACYKAMCPPSLTRPSLFGLSVYQYY